MPVPRNTGRPSRSAKIPIREALEQVLSHLDDQSARAAVLGGLAVSVWAEPRFTRDVDLAVAVRDDADAERLVGQLTQRGYRLLATVEQMHSISMFSERCSTPMRCSVLARRASSSCSAAFIAVGI